MKLLLAFLRAAAVTTVLGLAVLALAGEAPETRVETPGEDPRAWTSGSGVVKAAGLAQALSGGGPYPKPRLTAALLSLDARAVDLDEIIGRRTLLFYFSATCHHCQAVAPELARLHARLGGDMDFIAIASGGNSTQEVEAFAESYGLAFPFYKDFARQFSAGIKATSTPTVLVVQPDESGGFESLVEFRPFDSGSGLLLEMQVRVQNKQSPWSAIEPGRYYGAKACGTCHEQEMASWLLTHHSVAYWTLYERKRAEDTACVGCHVTGLGLPTGFSLGDHESPLTDVTCEACHGPGGAHGGERRSPEQLRETCVGCHDAEHSLRFEVRRAIPHIDHYRAARLDPEAYRLARETLLACRAPRPLLAFPE
ncbi:MAG: multiheme c-type cytochrome [Myxococcota bacterium]|nr:multiheme c-type cytochrome [Myxococcota bacterium]